jgi:hypothetical protein
LVDLADGRGQPVHPRLVDDVGARQRDRAPEEVGAERDDVRV